MTVEIIRNGIKIERCRYSELLYGAVYCNKPGLHEACNDNPECEYKQLKRLEQENKYYQQTLDDEITISDLITKCNDLEQENKELKSALEKINDLCIHYKNTNDKCITNCYAHFIVTDLIQNKINEVLK